MCIFLKNYYSPRLFKVKSGSSIGSKTCNTAPKELKKLKATSNFPSETKREGRHPKGTKGLT